MSCLKYHRQAKPLQEGQFPRSAVKCNDALESTTTTLSCCYHYIRHRSIQKFHFYQSLKSLSCTINYHQRSDHITLYSSEISYNSLHQIDRKFSIQLQNLSTICIFFKHFCPYCEICRAVLHELGMRVSE